MDAKQLQERLAEADARGNRLLAEANEAAEAGKKSTAERLYQKGQFWLDRSNSLREKLAVAKSKRCGGETN